MRHVLGLAASPPVRYKFEAARRGYFLSGYRPPAKLAKRMYETEHARGDTRTAELVSEINVALRPGQTLDRGRHPTPVLVMSPNRQMEKPDLPG
jgi:hypothetical protein